MQAAELCDQVLARPEVQVVRVAEHDLGTEVDQLRGSIAFTDAFVPTGMNAGVSIGP